MQRTVVVGSIAAFVVALVATVILLPAAHPSSGRTLPPEDAATFLTRIVGYIVSDDYDRAWPSLYPAQQSVAPRDEYVACERLTPVGWALRSVDVVRVRETHRRIPGATEPTAVTAVTLRLRIANAALHTEGAFTHTFTAVRVASRWTWTLTPNRFELYRDDRCATGSSPTPMQS
jgi:hypothetical protein